MSTVWLWLAAADIGPPASGRANRRMFIDVNDKQREAQRQVNDFLTGRGQIGVWVCLGVLAIAFVWVTVAGLLA